MQTFNDFNPRAPCGARRERCGHAQRRGAISIHAPRVGRDLSLMLGEITEEISIHAPRVGRDRGYGRVTPSELISIHAPRVGRDHCVDDCCKLLIQFQSTRPVWGATICRHTAEHPAPISIHAPRVGRDNKPVVIRTHIQVFQSTRPVWGATGRCTARFTRTQRFQSTRPVWGATANLTILPRQICTKGTKEFLLGRKTHGKKEK